MLGAEQRDLRIIIQVLRHSALQLTCTAEIQMPYSLSLSDPALLPPHAPHLTPSEDIFT